MATFAALFILSYFLFTGRVSVRFRLIQLATAGLLIYRSVFIDSNTSINIPNSISVTSFDDVFIDSQGSLLEILCIWLKVLPSPLCVFIGDICVMILLFSCHIYVSNVSNFFGYTDWLRKIKQILFEIVRDIPVVQEGLRKEQSKLSHDLDKDLKKKGRNLGQVHDCLPKKGIKKEEILDFLRDVTAREYTPVQEGLVSGSVYYGNQDHSDLLNAAFALYSNANPLHAEIWPSGMKLESEVIAMTASLVKGTCSTVCGSTTSGGTESIILAIKSHRDYYRRCHGITRPELVCAISAHAAVDKACDLMGIHLIRVPLDTETYTISMSHVKRAISANTILIYASAPCYPQGTIDPIETLSGLAVKHSVGLHVDCCLGGFVLPFAKRLGYNIPDFDFSLPGVSSMSLDTHKYGCALKGSSVVLYRHEELRRSQYFCYGEWSGGLYTTPTLAGSRSTGLIAQCWASLLSLGEERYMELTRGIMETTRAIAREVALVPELQLLGRAEAMIVCFAGSTVNVYRVADAMTRRGWSLNSLQNPASVHFCVTSLHIDCVAQFSADIRASVADAKLSPSTKDGGGGGGQAAVYGATASLPSGPVNELLKVYNDVVLNL